MGLLIEASARLVRRATGEAVSVVPPANAAKKLSNSLRANASRLQISGGCAGVVGMLPANGFSTKPTTFDTSLVTAVSGLSGAVVPAGCVVSPEVTWAAII